MFRIISPTLILALAFQAQAYFPVSKMLPLSRDRNLDHYANYPPACTLNLDLNDHGASGFLDVHFTASTAQYRTTDSLEILSVLCLPRAFSIDSMILWVDNKPQPGQLISIGQAEATYDNIVYVTRRDPAYIRRINGYPDNYGYYPYRSYENQFELKVFPVFQGRSRHVRIYLDCHADMMTGFNSYNLGYPMGAVIRVNTQQSTANIPSVSAGTLSLFSAQGRIGYQIAGVGDASPLTLALAPAVPFTRGYAGAVQTTGTGTNFFKLSLDFSRLFDLSALTAKRKITFVWVPSRSAKTSAVNYYEEERQMLSDYIAGFKATECLNIVYAGNSAEMFEPHMIAASATSLQRAQVFLSSRIDADTRGIYEQSFPALVKAFASIASSDTPAAVFCMDREPLPEGGAAMSTARVDSMKNVIVQINVNRTKFFAFVHWSKAFFYSRLATALGGVMSCYDPSLTYHSPYATSRKYDFAQIDKAFTSTLFINNCKVALGADYSNIITSRQVTSYDDLVPFPCTRVDLLGQCSVNYLIGTASAVINNQPFQTQFLITDRGAGETGLNLNKLWAFDMVEVFARDVTFSYYQKKREYALSSASPTFAALTGTILDNALTYRTMVELSLANRVVTGAAALLALEPGMELNDTDRFDSDDGTGPSTAIESSPEKPDSLDSALSASPNPFNPNTAIRLNSGSFTGLVTLNIYGPDGRLVRSFKTRPENGRATFAFDGLDANGVRLASGVYVARAVCGKKVFQMKLMLLK